MSLLQSDCRSRMLATNFQLVSVAGVVGMQRRVISVQRRGWRGSGVQQRGTGMQQRGTGVQQRGWRVNGVLSTCHKQSMSVHWRITEMPRCDTELEFSLASQYSLSRNKLVSN
jgi:hypothetical protein